MSPERIQGELVRLLQTDDPVRGIRLLVDTGLMAEFLPEIPALRLEVDEHHHHKDVYEHSLTVLRQAIELEQARNPGCRARRRRCGSRRCCTTSASPRPASSSPAAASRSTTTTSRAPGSPASACRRCGSTPTRRRSSTRLIELHLRFFGYAEGAWTDSAVRRYVRDAGAELERLHILTRADVTTRNAKKAGRLARAYDDIERRIAELSAQEELDAMRPELDGNRIQEVLGIRPGREVGEAYRFLLDLRLDEGVVGEDEAERRLLDWWAARA